MWALFGVAFLWGVTNPLLNRPDVDAASSKAPDVAPQAALTRVVRLLLNWRFVLPFALNQLGSVLYLAALRSSQLSLAQPICNSLATLFTAITARLLGEAPLSSRALTGIFCILAGVSLCLQQ